MDKRLMKRHKRQVARAKARVKPSEPDVRIRINSRRRVRQAAP